MEIIASGYGTPDVLEARVTNAPEPTDSEVTIAVHAASVNHRDYAMYADGRYAEDRGITPTFPLRLGVEASGTVTAVGAKAIGPAGSILVGDEVIAYRIDGAYADEITVAAENVVPKPTNLTWEQAASVMLAGTTAAHALAVTEARHGETILIHAAGGSVGIAAVQLAVLDGVRVIGTASTKDFERLRNYGVTPIAYGVGLLDRVREVAPEGVHAALDFIGTDEAIDVSLQLVPNRRRVVTIVNVVRAKQEGFQMIGGSAGQDPDGLKIRDAARLRLTALAQAKAFDVPVGRTFPLAEAAEAHRLIAKGSGGGHIVLLA